MANLIVQAMQNQSATNNQNNALGIIGMLKSSKNPNMMLQRLASSNPVVANTMNLINQYGGNPQKAFYEEAKKRGIDPNQILGMLK